MRNMRNLTLLLLALYSDVGKNYIGANLLALKYCSRNFLKCLSYLYEVVRTNFSADFSTFHNF